MDPASEECCSKKHEEPVRSDMIESSPIEMVLGKHIGSLFKQGTATEKCIDPMGYDIRLGDELLLVTRGQKMSCDDTVMISPGETILAKSEEVLKLPVDVCAIGSPKMSLLMKGLWAHGGKTDFGYNQPLTLSFRHVGANPIPLKRGDKIFHLTFLRVKANQDPYCGRGPDFPDVVAPPLEDSPKLTKDLEKETREKEGVQVARIIHLLRIEFSSLRRVHTLGLIFNAFAVILAVVAILVPSIAAYSLIGIVAALVAQSGLGVLFDRIIPHRSKREEPKA